MLTGIVSSTPACTHSFCPPSERDPYTWQQVVDYVSQDCGYNMTELAVDYWYGDSDVSGRWEGAPPPQPVLSMLSSQASDVVGKMLAWVKRQERRGSVAIGAGAGLKQLQGVSVVKFQQLLKHTGPPCYTVNSAAMLDLFHRINESGSGHISAEELASSVTRIADSEYHRWLLHLSSGALEKGRTRK